MPVGGKFCPVVDAKFRTPMGMGRVVSVLLGVLLLVALVTGGAEGDSEKEKKSFFYFTFIDVWRFSVYWICLWMGGKGAEAVRYPRLQRTICQ